MVCYDLILFFYGFSYGLFMLIYSFKLDHVLRHWEFGLINGLATIPVVHLYLMIGEDYYLSLIIINLTISVVSFFIDFDGFLEWFNEK